MIVTNLQSIPNFLSIDEYRFLMVVWFLTKSETSLSITPAYVDIGLFKYIGFGLGTSVLTENYGA